MSAPSIDCASSVEPLPLRHMQKRQGAWLNRRLPLILTYWSSSWFEWICDHDETMQRVKIARTGQLIVYIAYDLSRH